MNAPLNLVQGTKEWMEFRASHYGASEAAAMLGLSIQLTRNDLLLYKKTGRSKEYSDWVQKNILDYGHEAENSARLITESVLSTDLFPVTCSSGKLSASCDGLTFDGEIAWEHKQWNEELAEYVRRNNSAPDTHMPQCQQILLVTRAIKLIFTVSDGTDNKRVSCDIHPSTEWFERIQAGWDQFESDLKNYEHKEFAEKPEPEAIMQLPTLLIQIKGEVIASNLPQFKADAETFIAKINTDLQTDEDFVNAEATVKFCDETEKKLESAKAAAIGQTASIDELMNTIDFIKESIRSKRLTLEKLVKTQKESIKDKIIGDAINLCTSHALQIDIELGNKVVFQKFSPSIFTLKNFETACKNKRTLASLHNAVDTEVAAIKIKLDELARVLRKNLTHLPEDLSLFRDLQSIITKPEDDFKLLVESRLSEQKRKEEEVAKRVAEELKAAEERGRAQAEAAAERERIARENEEKLAIEAKESEARKLEQEAKAKESMEAHRAEVQKREEDRTKADERHRINILETVCQSFKDAGFNHQESERIVTAIKSGDIPHVTINF
ncbi:MAG: YqaJ viral recombinase family protein [Patescibacteria group bacterium]